MKKGAEEKNKNNKKENNTTSEHVFEASQWKELSY